MTKILFIVLIGLPASGKSTFCSQLVEVFTSEERACIHVEFDRFIQGVTDFKESRLQLLDKIKEAVKCLCANSTNNELLSKLPRTGSHFSEVVFLLDDNMYYRSMRYDIFKMARLLCHPPEYTVHYAQIYLKSSLDDCLINNRSRSGASQVPDDIIRKMAETIEEPDDSFWEKFTFVVNNDLSAEKVDQFVAFIQNVEPVVSLEFLETSAKDLESKREVARNETLNSVVHQCELALRNVISFHLNRDDLSTEEKKQRSAFLQRIKKEVIVEVRNSSFLSVNEAKKFVISLFSSKLVLVIEKS